MKPITIGKWCKTWKSLILTYNLFELFLLAVQAWAKYIRNLYGLSLMNGLSLRIDVPVIIIHFCACYEMFLYVKNYKMMIKEQPQKKSRVKFAVGLIMMVLIEILSVLVTIFL